MSWLKTKLGNVVTLKRGYDLPSSHREEGTVPIVSSSGITGYHSISKVKGPGVVTGRYGTLGEVYFVKEEFWPLNTALYVQDFKGNHRKFIFYFLQHILSRMDSNKAAVPGVNRNDLHARSVLLPDFDTQERIVALLSNYDDLIDNNHRRILFLEESARLLYKEWFVHLRYPGHEHVPVVNGVPYGWKKSTLGSIGKLNYGKALTADDRIPGIYPVYGSSGVVGWHEKPLITGPGIVIGRKGNVGSVYWSDDDFYPIDTVYFIDTNDSSFYLYYALLHIQFINTDVAVPGLNRELAHKKEILVAEDRLRSIFEEHVKPLHKQMFILRKNVAALSKARDLLLPRLMNGEIAV